jgi:hypothetical protein
MFGFEYLALNKTGRKWTGKVKMKIVCSVSGQTVSVV